MVTTPLRLQQLSRRHRHSRPVVHMLKFRHPNDIAGCQSAQTHLHSANRDLPDSSCEVSVR